MRAIDVIAVLSSTITLAFITKLIWLLLAEPSPSRWFRWSVVVDASTLFRGPGRTKHKKFFSVGTFAFHYFAQRYVRRYRAEGTVYVLPTKSVDATLILLNG